MDVAQGVCGHAWHGTSWFFFYYIERMVTRWHGSIDELFVEFIMIYVRIIHTRSILNEGLPINSCR